MVRTYKHIVSLGSNCRPAYNIRATYRGAKAFPFDWWLAPLAGTIRFLEHPRIETLYHPDELELLIEDGKATSVINRHYGLQLFHEFPREDGAVVPDFRRFIEEARGRTEHLLERLRSIGPEEPTLFVKSAGFHDPKDEQSWKDGSQRILDALAGSFGLKQADLLLINTPLQHDLPGVQVRHFADREDDWRGDTAAWTRTLLSIARLEGEESAFVPLSPIAAKPEPSGPELAVVVLSVGAQPDLRHAVQSLLAQSVPAEIVVVNSGGGDVTSVLPQGKGITVVDVPDVLWPGAARNLGIEATTARYVAFLAADCRAEPGWNEARLKRHRDGARAVASAVVNSAPRSAVALASHLLLYGRRLPGMPEAQAHRYGASYDRQLFEHYGYFLEDLRIGEDTEFHRRIGKSNQPVWAPEIRTVHLNPTALWASLGDQYRRGVRSGQFWPNKHVGRFADRVRTRLGSAWASALAALEGAELGLARRAYALLALNALMFEIGARQGRRTPDPLFALHARALAAEHEKDWELAQALWRRIGKLSTDPMVARLGAAKALMRLKQFDAAQEAYRTLRTGHPGVVFGYEGLARIAEKRRDWSGALAAWSDALQRFPRRFPAQKGQARALLELGQLDEAEAAYGALDANWPEHRSGLNGLVRVAAARGDWHTMLARYDMLWWRFNDPAALEGQVQLLIGLGHFDAVTALVEELGLRGSDRDAYLRSAGLLLEARHDWARLVKLLGANREHLDVYQSSLQRFVNALAILGRGDEAVAAVQSSSAGSPTWRKGLLATALMRAGRHTEADRQLLEIAGDDVPQVSPAMLGAMTTVVLEHGGSDAAEAALDRLVAGAGSTLAGNNLRIGAAMQRLRLLSWSGQAIDPPPEKRVRLSISKRSRDGEFAEFTEMSRRFEKLRKTHPTFCPNPSFMFKDALGAAQRVVAAISDSQPLSLLRLGDGEGNFLPYRAEHQKLQATDREATLRTWWGGGSLDAGGEAVLAEFSSAIADADIVGIPDLYRLGRARTERIHLPGGSGKAARGLLAVLDHVLPLIREEQLVTSCHVHEAFGYWDLWEPLLRRAGTVSLITSHAPLAGAVGTLFGVAVDAVHLIPTERKFASGFGPTPEGRHFPDRFEALRDALSKVPRGRVHLVAAGFLGKIYCHWIKQAGGIAIDIGSAADRWCGFETRGIEEMAAYRGPKGVREHFADGFETLYPASR